MDEQPKLKRLKKLVASEVSLVQRGAVRRPFLVVKNEEGLVPSSKKQAPQRDLFAITPEQDAKIDAVIAKRAQPIAKDERSMGAAADATSDDLGDNTDDSMPDERSMAALKAVYRILLPFKGQISEDMVDDVLAELDLDDTGEDGQDDDNDGVDDSVDADVDPKTEEEAAMAKSDDMPEELKKGASWQPTQPEGMSDDDYNKAVAAAKAAFSGACSKDAGDDEDDEDKEDDVKKNVAKAALPQHAELVAKAEAEKKQWIAKAAELEARLSKMEDERVLKSHEDDVRRDCQVLGKDPVQQAAILKSAFAASAEAGKAYRDLLAESASMSREGVFKSVGTSSNASFGAYVPSEGQGTARTQLEAMVKGLVQKGESKDEAAAWATVLNTKRGQELYAADRNGGH